jgi:hypothetical protein
MWLNRAKPKTTTNASEIFLRSCGRMRIEAKKINHFSATFDEKG